MSEHEPAHLTPAEIAHAAAAALIVQAPMAGGPSTPALAAAVSEAGGFGFIAAGYLDIDGLRAEIEQTRTLTSRPFGVNIFAPTPTPASRHLVDEYAALLAPMAAQAGVDLGPARFEDDHFDAKLAIVLEMRPAVVSFTFGSPDPGTIRELQARDIEVWITVNSADEARTAGQSGADALIVQGSEAGGHQGSFTDTDDEPLALLDLLGVVRGALTELPRRFANCRLIATGGLHTGEQIGRALDAGASAVQLGTAFMRCPEAGTSAAHREALSTAGSTTLSRAFTGRRGRGIVNAWTEGVGRQAPKAYPEVHHLTKALRAHGRRVGDTDLFNLWAGVGHEQARVLPAGQIVTELAEEVVAVRSR
jgi:nitronate monooxygenase